MKNRQTRKKNKAIVIIKYKDKEFINKKYI